MFFKFQSVAESWNCHRLFLFVTVHMATSAMCLNFSFFGLLPKFMSWDRELHYETAKEVLVIVGSQSFIIMFSVSSIFHKLSPSFMEVLIVAASLTPLHLSPTVYALSLSLLLFPYCCLQMSLSLIDNTSL